MATRAALTVYPSTPLGLQPVYTTGVVADGHKFLNTGREIVYVKNSDAGGAHTITFQTPETRGGLAVAEGTGSVALSNEKHFGPFPRETFNQTDGYVYIDYEAAEEAHLSVYVIQVIPA